MDATNPGLHDPQHQVKLITRFMSPFALGLILFGVFVGDIQGRAQLACFALFGFSAFFNLVFPRFLSDQKVEARSWNVNFRLFLNLVINTALVFIVWPSFRPMWLILALTPFATAVYGSWRRTLTLSLVTAAILLVIHALRNEPGLGGWIESFSEAAFVVLISLLIHGVSRLSSEAAATKS
jgi:hypothetical protein